MPLPPMPPDVDVITREALLILRQTREGRFPRAETERIVPPGCLRHESDFLRFLAARDDLPPTLRRVLAGGRFEAGRIS